MEQDAARTGKIHDSDAVSLTLAHATGLGAGRLRAGMTLADELERVVAGEHPDPHAVLGAHERTAASSCARSGRARSRCACCRSEASPSSSSCAIRRASSRACCPGRRTLPRYRLEIGYPDAPPLVLRDPYSFAPTLGELDLHLIAEGRHERLWEALGAHPRTLAGATGTRFAVWAPAARAVSVVGDFNDWDERSHPMRSLGSAGVWELFVPEAGRGSRLQVRDPRRGRDGPPQGRSARAARRAAAAHRLDRLRARPPLARRGLAGRAEVGRAARRADVGLRGAPRLVAPQPARGQPLADLRGARPTSWPTTRSASASRTSS